MTPAQEPNMFDLPKFDKTRYPSTGFVAEFLQTHSGFKWVLQFFEWVRKMVDANQFTEHKAFEEFKLRVSKALNVKADQVDWPIVFNLFEELTRPKEPASWYSSTVLRAPHQE
jgi:hypothetical protein